MSPETHLLASWLIAARKTTNLRDTRLVALAGILPDADGLGLIVDGINAAVGSSSTYYQNFHHYLLHGIFGATLVSGILAAFSANKLRVAILAFTVFHLHLLCDLVGSRGPTVDDLWPIYYFGPFSREWGLMSWSGQWRLDGWQNRYISVALLGWALWISPKLGHSFVGVFNRKIDGVFVGVLQKWQTLLTLSQSWKRLATPPWRTAVPMLSLVLFVGIKFILWQPGLDIRDGSHDRKQNGIWLSHGWLGHDSWFANGTTHPSRFRDPDRIRELRDLLRQNHIKDVFPHLCPADENGIIPPVDAAQTERFLDEFEKFRVMPWAGGPNGSHVRLGDPNWTAAFRAGISNLFVAHPRFAGVHVNVEPLPSGDTRFLTFLTELRSALPPKKLLSVAAYPPPTRWHPFPDVHWDENFFREVAWRVDQLAVMMYDTGVKNPKFYTKLMNDWTVEVLDWSGGKPVLLGIPTYWDADSGYHDPKAENMESALGGIHRALSERPFHRSYQGVAIYCEWETDAAEWEFWRRHFLKP